MNENIMIQVKQLRKSYGDVEAVKGISFQVYEGQLFAFLGQNGAGKSTTINIISGILKKNDGTIEVGGIDIDREPMKVKGKIGIVFQGSVLDGKLTVYDNLKTRAALYGVTGDLFKERLKELETILFMGDILKRPLEKLSGGQRRKADIARALLHKPDILILDEPTTGLDPQTRAQVWSCLDRLRRDRGLTVFLTTHYMEEASEADDVVILDRGEIVAHGSPNDLKNRLAHDYIKIFGNPAGLEEMVTKEKLTVAKKEQWSEIKVPTTAEARDLLVKYPEVFDDFEITKGKMDDVFLNVTGKALKEAEYE